MIKFISIIITTLFLTFQVFTQTFDQEKLDTYFIELEESNKFMGSVAIFKDGEILYSKSIGYADLATLQMPNNNTKYRIGSISKTFTTVLIFKAIEEGKLTLTENISPYFPTIKNAKKITIEHLLYHRSGIFNFTSSKEFISYYTTKQSESEMVKIISDLGSNFKPGKKAQYSNSNFVLLSYLLQKIYKQPYTEILNAKIIEPLQLKRTAFGDIINPLQNECYSYSFHDQKWNKEKETHVSVPLGAGAIVSTPSDLLKFSDAIFSYKLISPENVKKMMTMKDNYGMGLFQMPFNDKMSFGHTGGIDGFSSVMGYFPNEKVAFAITSNGSNYDNNKISLILLSSLFDKPFEIPSFKLLELSSEELNQYIGVYSCAEFPLKITISKSENSLIAKADGQPSFPLDATAINEFKYDRAGIVFEFNSEKNQMTFKQGGGTYIFEK